MARRHISTNRPDTLTQTFFPESLFPCSQKADHTFRKRRIELAQNATFEEEQNSSTGAVLMVTRFRFGWSILTNAVLVT